MPGILADVNCQGHFQLILRLLRDESRRDLWTALGWTTPSFADIGLWDEATDLVVWQTCQHLQLVLITINRTEKGSDSLETTIRSLSTLESLPVITLANPARFLHDRPYAERVVDQLLERLYDIEMYRGTGRLFFPVDAGP